MKKRKALANLKKQLKLLPDDCGEAIFSLAKDFDKLGVHADVVELFYRRAIKAGVFDACAYLGTLQEEAGHLRSALSWYLEAWRHCDPYGASSVGAVLEATGDLDRAFLAYSAASKENPEAFLWMSNVRRKQGDNQAAKQILRDAAEVSWSCACDLADYYLDGQDGIALLERHKAEGNDDVDLMLGILYHRAGAEQEEEELLTKLVENDEIDAMTNLGELYLEQGKARRAYKLLKRAAKLGDDMAADDLAKIVKDASTPETSERVANHPFARIYDEYVDQVRSSNGSVAELRKLMTWLTGYDEAGLDKAISDDVTLRDFFGNAPQINENADLIKGKIYGIRVAKIKDQFVQNVRRLDKLVDDLAKGKEPRG